MCVSQLVGAESVTGAREAEGEAWCVEDMDVEQAAREQAAAARNKRRALLDGPLDEEALAAMQAVSEQLGLTRSASIMRSGGTYLGPSRPYVSTATGKRKGPGTSSGSGTRSASPHRKKKRLAPASNTCLACTKGKHCAHTCGVRGKAAEAAAKAAAEAAAGIGPGPSGA